MAGNTHGSLFKIMTFGESHGPFIGVVIDGLRPGIPIDADQLQAELTRRRPGQSAVTTPRQEKDQAQIVSGIFEGKTTGTPLCLIIPNEDQRSKDYSTIKDVFRPGHASFTYLKKYGVFDYRGGGRASGRETATRVAAGAVARQVLEREYGITFTGFTRQVGDVVADAVVPDFIETNPVRCPDPAVAERMERLITDMADAGDSIGGGVEVRIHGLPAGLGDPVFEKLDAELAHGLMSIGAVKGFEIGDGFAVANQRGSATNDVFHMDDAGAIVPKTNHSGGVLGGISTGQEVVVRLAVKPPSSIRAEQVTVDREGNPFTLSIGGRHDPCICPRVVPVAEAMCALVILDLLLVQAAIAAEAQSDRGRELARTDAQLLLLLARRRALGGADSPLDLDTLCAELGLEAAWVRAVMGGEGA